MPAIELASTPLFSDANLKGYWKLEDGSDSGPNGYTMAGTTRGAVAGKFNNGLDFESSSSDYITNASATDCLVSGSQTWSCWVKAESTGSGGVYRIFGRMLASAPFNGVSILRAPSTDYIGFQCYGLTTNTVVYSGTELDVGNWQHLVGVYDSSLSKLKIFVNGVKTEVTASGTILTGGSEAVSIGRSGAYASDNFDGVIDDAAIFSRALSDTEVSDLYNGNYSNVFIPKFISFN